MAIKDWHQDERPREKLLQKGAESLSDSEILAILLRTGTKDQSAIELARGLIEKFGSVDVVAYYLMSACTVTIIITLYVLRKTKTTDLPDVYSNIAALNTV